MNEKNLIPTEVIEALNEPKYRRAAKSPQCIQALTRLQIRNPLFKTFFEAYEGPFWSERLGVELLDLVEGSETIEKDTKFCHSRYNWPSSYVVLTKFAVGQVMVLDDVNDKVYEVDFEGGEKLLVTGALPVRWESLALFLSDCFAESS